MWYIITWKQDEFNINCARDYFWGIVMDFDVLSNLKDGRGWPNSQSDVLVISTVSWDWGYWSWIKGPFWQKEDSFFVSYLFLLLVLCLNSEVHSEGFKQCYQRSYSASVIFVLYVAIFVLETSSQELSAALHLDTFAPLPSLPSVD